MRELPTSRLGWSWVLAVATLLARAPTLVGQVPDRIPSDPEAQIFNLYKRVTALEEKLAAITSGRVRAPFEVVDATGEPILQVVDGEGFRQVKPTGVVVGEDLKTGAGLVVVQNKAGESVAVLGTDGDIGGLFLADAEGKVRSRISGEGKLRIFDQAENPILVVAEDISQEEAEIRIGGDDDGYAVEVGRGNGEAILGIDPDGVAQLALTDAQNQERAYLDAEGTLLISDESGWDILRVADDVTGDKAGVAIGGGKSGGVVRVTDAAGKPAAGILGAKRSVVVVSSAGKTVSEMVASEAGNGLFQVWAGGEVPIALLGRAPGSEGGIVQISNGKVPVTSLYASDGGAGRWQLADNSGTPVVEAGAMGSGRGTVRVGPNFKCVPITMSLRVPDCIVGRTE